MNTMVTRFSRINENGMPLRTPKQTRTRPKSPKHDSNIQPKPLEMRLLHLFAIKPTETQNNKPASDTHTKMKVSNNMASSTNSTSTEQSTQPQKTERRVHFGQVDQVHMIPEEDLDPDTWYGADEMKMAFRADVIAFLKEYKRSQLREEVSDSDEEEEEEEPICSRGLEMYFPGEIAQRKKLRAIFAQNVLRKSKDLNEIFDDPHEAGNHLQLFASALSQTAQKKAHAMGLQDAVEARIVYAEGLEETNAKDPTTLEFVPHFKHESKTALSTCKARAA